MGTVLIKKCVNGQWMDNFLKNVLCVSDLRRNIFSKGAIVCSGFVIIMRNTNAPVHKHNKVILIATQKFAMLDFFLWGTLEGRVSE